MSFKRYALERTAATAVGFLLALTILFVGSRVVDYGPAAHFSRDASLPDRYGEFLGDAVQGSWGQTLEGHSVRARVRDAVPVTLSLVVGGLTAALLLGRLVAEAPSVRLIRVLGYLAIGAGVMWVGLWLAYLVGFKLGLTAISGYCYALDGPPGAFGPDEVPCVRDPLGWAHALLLPWLTLSLPFAAIYARVIHSARLGEEARRRRALQVAKLVGRDFGFALGLASVVEATFGLPGLGALAFEGAYVIDAQLLEGVVIAATALALTVQLAVDLVCGRLEPELRLP